MIYEMKSIHASMEFGAAYKINMMNMEFSAYAYLTLIVYQLSLPPTENAYSYITFIDKRMCL